MAPEAPGNLVVLDLHLKDTQVECHVDRYDPRGAVEFVKVSWNAIECPPGYVPAGGGVVFVSRPLGYEHKTYRAAPDLLEGQRFSWIDEARGDGLMLIIVLPPGYLLPRVDDADPLPVVSKVFQDRMALYWLIRPSGPRGAQVSWRMQARQIESQEMVTHCASLNDEAARRRVEPVPAPVILDPIPKAGDSPVVPPLNDRQSSQQPLSPWAYLGVSAIGFVAAVALLVFFVEKGPELIRNGMSNRVFYFLLIPLGLATAAFVFGGMRSFAKFTGTVLSGTLELGGPAVVAGLIVIGGFKLVPEPSDTFAVTVRVHDQEGLPVKQGALTVYLGQDPRSAPIAPNGEANFKEIPFKFRNSKSHIIADVSGYKLTVPAKKYSLADEVIDVEMSKVPDADNVVAKAPTPTVTPSHRSTRTATPEPTATPSLKPLAAIEAYCDWTYHKATNDEPDAWHDANARAACPSDSHMIFCRRWKEPNGYDDPNTVASSPVPDGEGGCICKCQHSPKEGLFHLGGGNSCGCYPLAVCASLGGRLPDNLEEVIKTAIAQSESCKAGLAWALKTFR